MSRFDPTPEFLMLHAEIGAGKHDDNAALNVHDFDKKLDLVNGINATIKSMQQNGRRESLPQMHLLEQLWTYACRHLQRIPSEGNCRQYILSVSNQDAPDTTYPTKPRGRVTPQRRKIKHYHKL